MKIKVCLIVLTALALMPVPRSFSGTNQDLPKKILAIQHQAFAPYERSFQGFKNGLENSDYSANIEVERFNAKNDLEVLEAKFLEIRQGKGPDLIFTVGTRATRMAMEMIHDIPIVFTDLGAPEYSGIIKDWKSSGANLTGVETPKYLGKGIDLLHQLIPFKRIGLIYLKGSPSHEGAVTQMTLISKNLGTSFVYDGFSLTGADGQNLSDQRIRELIAEKLGHLLPRVDVFFVQPSKTFFDHFDLFLKGFKEHKVLSAGDPIYIKRGIVLGLDRSKFEFGTQCADYAIKIFRGTPPAQLPMDVGQHFTISFNLKAAAFVGFRPPMDLLAAADAIYQDFEGIKISDNSVDLLDEFQPKLRVVSGARPGQEEWAKDSKYFTILAE